MKFDYTRAETFTTTLRNEGLAAAFSKINMAAGQYFADDVGREEVMRSFCVKRGFDLDGEMEAISNDLIHMTEIPAHDANFDLPAREMMLRWAIKENFLDVAMNSGAVRLDELTNLDSIKPGTFTVQHTVDLRKLGFPKLATIASGYILRDLK